MVELLAIRCGVFESVKHLSTKIHAFIDGWNGSATPSCAPRTPEVVLKKANRQPLSIRGTRYPPFVNR